MLTTSLKLADKYNYLEDKFKKAYQFLREADLMALPLGRTDIDGDNIFVNVQEYISMPANECKYEAHNKYFDIQYVVEGKEQFLYVAREGLEIDTPYDDEKDLVFFKDPELDGSVLLKAGDLAIVAPEDAHKPRCIADVPCKVRKIVIKIKA